MKSRFAIIFVFILTLAISAVHAQNSNSSAPSSRPRTTSTPAAARTPTRQPPSTDVQQPASTAPRPVPRKQSQKFPELKRPGRSVIAAFNRLVNGIRRANAKAVANVYLNSPRLILFNNNGTVIVVGSRCARTGKALTPK